MRDTDFDLRLTTTFNPDKIRDILNAADDSRLRCNSEVRDRGPTKGPARDAPDTSSMADPPSSTHGEQAAFADELDAQGRYEAARGAFMMARALHERAVELRRHIFGEADPKLVHSLTWIGALSFMQGQIDEASWFLDQAHVIAVKSYGRQHIRVAVTLHNLGVVARRRGDLESAVERYEQALAVKVQSLGWMHPSVATTLVGLGNLARARGDAKVAMNHYVRSREIYERTEGAVSSGLASSLVGMAKVYIEEQSFDAAILILERAVRIHESTGALPIRLAGARALLARLLSTKWPVEAHNLMRTTVKAYEASSHANPEYVEALRRALREIEAVI